MIIGETSTDASARTIPEISILTPPDGGFVMIDRIGIGGGDVTHFYGVGDCWMVKCDSIGNIEWEKLLATMVG